MLTKRRADIFLLFEYITFNQLDINIQKESKSRQSFYEMTVNNKGRIKFNLQNLGAEGAKELNDSST